MSDLTAPCGHVEAAKGGIHRGESAGDGLDNLQDIRNSSIGCPRCDHLASEVMRLREDRNEWRRMYIWLRRLVNALLDVIAAVR